MDRLALLVVFASLLVVGPVSAQVRTAALPPIAAVQTERPRLADSSAAQALRRALRGELVDAGLAGTCRHYRLPVAWARLAGVESGSPAAAGHLAYHLTGSLFDRTVGITVHHPRGWEAMVKVDLDDRRVAVETGTDRLNYGISYAGDGTVEALFRLPF